jgi:hypothetical protein
MVITNEHGETIKFRDSVSNLLKSPMFQELRESLRTLWHYSKIHGWGAVWSEVLFLSFDELSCFIFAVYIRDLQKSRKI